MVASRQQGLTYLAVLFMVAAMGVWLASIGTLWHTTAQRAKEQALLDVGRAYRDAIHQFYEQSPGVVKRYPESLDDLLLDKRHLTVKRYLRKLYLDPISGTADWGLVMAPQGGVAGVFSQSLAPPMKIGGFAKIDATFEGSTEFSDWKFVYLPATMAR